MNAVDTRWGQRASPHNADYVVQPNPNGQASSKARFWKIPHAYDTVHKIDFRNDRVRFSSRLSNQTDTCAPHVEEFRFLNTSEIPVPDGMKASINLWRFHPQTAGNSSKELKGNDLTVVFSNFTFTPALEARHEELNDVFQCGSPDANSFPAAGLLTHQWDYEDSVTRWIPVSNISGQPADDRVSCCVHNHNISLYNGTISIYNAGPNYFDPYYTPGGVIINPEHAELLCTYAGDGGTFYRNDHGCGCFFTPPHNHWCHNNSCESPNVNKTESCAWPPGDLSSMMQQMRQKEYPYNEAILDPEVWKKGLPGSISAFWYPNGGNCSEACVKQVTDTHALFIERYPDTNTTVPLLELDLQGNSRPFRKSLLQPPPQVPNSTVAITYWDGRGATWDGMANSPYDYIILSFATFAQGEEDGRYDGIVKPEDLFKIGMPTFAHAQGIQKLQSHGKKVLISLGGGDKKLGEGVFSLAPRIYTALLKLQRKEESKGKTAKRFAQAVKEFVQANKLDGVDFDNEETHCHGDPASAVQAPLGDEMLSSLEGVAFMAELILAIREALDAVTTSPSRQLMMMAVQPTGFVPLVANAFSGPHHQSNEFAQLLPRVMVDPATGKFVNGSEFPVKPSKDFVPIGCTKDRCYYQYFMALVMLSPKVMQSLDHVILMLYPNGNLWMWGATGSRFAPGNPKYRDQNGSGALNLFSIYDSIVSYQMRQSVTQPSTQIEPHGRLNANRIILGTQIADRTANASWINVTILREQMKLYNKPIGGISVWPETALCTPAGNELAQMIHELALCRDCPEYFEELLCPRANGLLDRVIYLASVAFWCLSCCALGQQMGIQAARRVEKKRKSQSQLLAVEPGNGGKRSVTVSLLAQGLLAKNESVTLHEVESLPELKQQIVAQTDLDASDDFDIVGTRVVSGKTVVVDSFDVLSPPRGKEELMSIRVQDKSSDFARGQGAADLAGMMNEDEDDDIANEEDEEAEEQKGGRQSDFARSLGAQIDRLVTPLNVSEWQHTRDKTPAPFQTYFKRPDTTKKIIGVGIAAYDEESFTLERTLQSLEDGFTHKLDRKDFSVQDMPTVSEGGIISSLGYYMAVLIMVDGVEKMSSSMCLYLERLFSVDIDSLKHSRANTSVCERARFASGSSRPTSVRANNRGAFSTTTGTAMHARDRDGSNSSSIASFNSEEDSTTGKRFPHLHLYLLVKMDNRRKHNSHEWLLRAFAQNISATYVLCSDTGTVFQKKCIKQLVKFMEQNPTVSGCTGTQAIMPAAMQAAPEERVESWMSSAHFYRSVQGYEYDITHTLDKPCFSLVGFMPVLPGPCGLFRMSDVRGLACDKYFALVHQKPEDLGLIGSNLCLAEDRVLTIESVCSSRNGTGVTSTKWVPEATFYSEAETELEMFVKQRRRWSNGTFAGWLWLCANYDKIWATGHSCGYKFLATVLVMAELVKSCLLLLAPTMWAVGLHISVEIVANTTADSTSAAWLYSPQHIAVVLYGGLYCMFVAYHLNHDFSRSLWTAVVVVNAGVVVLLLASWVLVLLYPSSSEHHHRGGVEIQHVVVMMGGFLILLVFPLFIKLVTGEISVLLRILQRFVHYILFLPTIIGWFGVYSLARVSDLKWGTRPDDSETIGHMHTTCIRLNIAVALLNVSMTGLILAQLGHIPVFLLFVAACCFASVLEMGLSLLFFSIRILCAPVRACRGETPELKGGEEGNYNSARRPLMHFIN
jgi:cellulose synthase/poly-beta-1,6-N-acetylglucosamine synthase-like glycosyltransferase